MKCLEIVGVAVFASLTAIPLLSQEKPGVVAEIITAKPKAGSVKQLELGAKKHMEWHRKQNDQWARFVWQIVIGERAGEYIVGTFGHHWKDFDGRDKFEEADDADVALNVAPFVEAVTPSFYTVLPDASSVPASEAPTPLAHLVHYTLKPEGIDDFKRAIGRITEAAVKSKWPPRVEWYQLASGGEGPSFVMSITGLHLFSTRTLT